MGHNFAHISRLEHGERLPDPAVVAAVFVPALELEQESEWTARRIALVEAAQQERHVETLRRWS